MVNGSRFTMLTMLASDSDRRMLARPLHHFAFCLLPFGAEFGSFPDDGDDNNNNRRQEVFGAYAFEAAATEFVTDMARA